MEPSIKYPGRKTDPRIAERKVYLFDLNGLQANIIKKIPGRLITIHNLEGMLVELREHPEQMLDCANKGIDQLHAIQEFIRQNTCVAAPGQQSEITAAIKYYQLLLRNELTTAEKLLGAAQQDIFCTGLRFEKAEPNSYSLFFDAAMQARNHLHRVGRAPWDGCGTTRSPSRIDLSIVATTAALAYDQGKSVVCISKDKAIGALLREIPNILGFKPDDHYIVARSIFSDVNGPTIIRVGKAYDRTQ